MFLQPCVIVFEVRVRIDERGLKLPRLPMIKDRRQNGIAEDW